MAITVLDVDRQAITAFVSKYLLIARTASGGTVKHCIDTNLLYAIVRENGVEPRQPYRPRQRK
jgi:hypothetical protein